MGAFEAIIDCLPVELQQRIRDRLQLLAQVQAKRGYDVASYFSRCLKDGVPKPDKREPRLKYSGR